MTKTKKLSQIASFLPKSKVKAGHGLKEGLYPFFTSSDTKVMRTNDYLYDGELIVLGTGGSASCNYYSGKFAVSTDNYVIKTENSVLPKFLYYFLRKDNLLILQNGFRGSGLEHISKAYISNINVPLFDIPTQKRIVDLLDLVNSSINLEKELISNLDSLIKSRFNEMFGEVDEDSKDFGLVPFRTFVDDMHIGPFGSDLKNDSFVPASEGYAMVYEQKHAIQKSMNVPTRYIAEDKFHKMKHFVVGPGDILVSCRGTLGECYLIPSNAPIGIIHPSLMFIRPRKGVNAKFLLSLLERILRNQEGKGSGVKMAIRASELAQIMVINPPQSLIESYISFVEKVDKLKFNAQERIKLYQELLNKKMDEYFG